MTARQRAALLALPDDEAAIVKHYSLSDEDMAAIDTARTPATRLGYALQLCCLRYPGRHRQGELLPAVMLDHIAEQVGVDANVIADFARRTPTRYDQLAAIKTLRLQRSEPTTPRCIEDMAHKRGGDHHRRTRAAWPTSG
jgi:TnpA family transposase